MRVAYFPAGDRAFASSRLRVYKIADVLQSQGHTVAFAPDDPLAYDCVVVQKRRDCAGLMRCCREHGVRVIFDCDDLIYDLPFAAASLVTVDTPYKRLLWPTAVVVPDALDVEAASPFKRDHATALTRAVWCGNAENAEHLRDAAAACRVLNIELIAVTDLRRAALPPGVIGAQWSLGSVDSVLIACDLFLAPFVLDGAWSADWVRSKSANRILKAWALGLPVAATGIESYVEAGLQYAASNVADWIGVLTALEAQTARQTDAERGQTIAEASRAEQVAEAWLKVFGG